MQGAQRQKFLLPTLPGKALATKGSNNGRNKSSGAISLIYEKAKVHTEA
jgi:hypothetical protein